MSELLTLQGVPVYVADKESRMITATSPIIREKLIKAFGNELYDGESLNKVLLASYIFNDKEKLDIVNSIIHPEVKKHFIKWLDEHASYDIVAHESAILFEAGLNLFVDKTVMIYAPLELRIERVMQRDRTSRDKVLERINSQMPDEEKKELSDFVIYNDGSASLITQTVDLLNEIRK